jgi:hypothetical protein
MSISHTIYLFAYSFIYLYVKAKVKLVVVPPMKLRQNNPITGLDRPLGFQEVEAPRFADNGHMNMVGFPALLIGRLYPPGNILGTQFC